MKKKVLAVTYGAGHVNMLLPVLTMLLQRKDIDLTVLGLTTAGEVLRRENIPFLGFSDLWSLSDEKAVLHGARLAKAHSSSMIPVEETKAYLGLNYRDLELRLGEEGAAAAYRQAGRQAFLPLTLMNGLFARLEPDLVLATNSPRAERAALTVAADLGVPSVCVVGLFAKQEIEWIGQPRYGTRVCVLAPPVKDDFIRAGRKEFEICVTGNPAFDHLGRPGLGMEGASMRSRRGWDGKKVILWASQNEPARHPFTGRAGDPTLPRRVDQELFSLLQRHPDWQLVIRPHPNEDVDFNSLPARVRLSGPEDDLAVLLNAVDVVLTMTSTVGMQGALVGKPMVALGESVFRADAPYADMGLANGVEHVDGLEKGLVDVLKGDWRSSVMLPSVGQATQNVVQVIDDLLSNR